MDIKDLRLDKTETLEVIRVKEGEPVPFEDQMAVEYPVTIFFNDHELVTLLCTPTYLEELAIGFLNSEGLIRSYDDIDTIRPDLDKGLIYVTTKKKKSLSEKLFAKRTITSGCGKGTIFYNVLDSMRTNRIERPLDITSEQVSNLMLALQQNSEMFKETGGNHASALCDPSGIVVYHEDIGRHNAVDKIVGHCVKNNINIEDKVLVTSGRVSSEILLKVAKLDIPMIISKSAPTTLSVRLARELGLTLAGFVRGRRFNIYANGWRITDVEVADHDAMYMESTQLAESDEEQQEQQQVQQENND
ncbi:hypothetical protein BHU72_06350 [Desulfuribacillus stibiiarsenatis]|uniref:Sulfur carrier protein FdhD n=1 Tax=Desulfuribacillus stibiiarsenatis TaxID=1390249 RepID=A0A1E5L5E4_9FIRM|nr:formate dehydrogenase accessory sulfurtransferase FdhD [Desulfuribacillus stibiiarsenatis]OEH85223.1 hypothetical protein BHU72_06350 [Desulfuribacillus stibiiarsenatis]